MVEKIVAIKRLVGKAKKIAIITHINPDGDAIGSTLALKLGLEKINKKIDIVCRDPIAPAFLFLPKVDEFKQVVPLEDIDLYIIIDCGDLKRTGFESEISKIKKPIINIDHHPQNNIHKLATINLANSMASSSAEILIDLIDALSIKLDSKISTCLLTAIYTDTGGFKHSNTHISTLELASRLLSAGARLQKIAKHFNSKKTITSLKLWGIVLSRLTVHKRFKIAFSIVTYEDFLKTKATLQNLEGVVNLIGSVPGAKAALLLTEMEKGSVKGSFRTENNKVDTSKIAKIFGGGGHKKASGFVINGSLFNKSGNWRIIQG